MAWLIGSRIIGLCDMKSDNNISVIRKIYFIDCGILNYISKMADGISNNIEGILAKNFAYCEIMRLYNTGYR